MIFRRLTHAFRKQDWFTVVVEIMIVVLGVFIGLQVNNWNEARQDSVREVRYLERMAEDFVSIQDRIQRGRQAADNSMASCLIALQAINVFNGEQPGELPTEEQLFDAVSHCGDNIRPTGTSATLQEMIASGAFAQLHNERLRSLLYEFDQSVEMFNDSYKDNMSYAFNKDDGTLDDISRFKVNLEAVNVDERYKIEGIDRDRALSDRHVRKSLLAFFDVAWVSLIWLEYQQERVDEIVDILSKEKIREVEN